MLDKLPQQAKTILAETLEKNLVLLALSAYEVVAALSQTSSQINVPSQPQLINEIFNQKLNKIIETLQAPNTTTEHTLLQTEGYRSNYYNSQPPFYSRFNEFPTNVQAQIPHLQIKQQFSAPKKLPDSTSCVGGVESDVNTGSLFTIYDKTNNITFVLDTGLTVSLLPQTFDSEIYNGPQDLLAVNYTSLTVQELTKLNVDLSHLQLYPWVFRVAGVPFGIIGCDFLTFHSFQVDLKNKRLSKPVRSDFHPPGPHEDTSSRADSAITTGLEHCSQYFITHSAVTEQNETDLAPLEERLNVKLKSTNTNIGETNSELKLQQRNKEASLASAAQQSKIEPSIKHRPTPLPLGKEKNTVKTQTESHLSEFNISPVEPHRSSRQAKLLNPP